MQHGRGEQCPKQKDGKLTSEAPPRDTRKKQDGGDGAEIG